MVSDDEMNFVYVSDLLAKRYLSVFEGLKKILTEHGIGFGVVSGTKDIWIRDFAPVPFDRDGSFVQFRYFPDYLRQGYRHLITDSRGMFSNLPGVRTCEYSDIILDGGNVVRHHDKAIVTDKVIVENPRMGREELLEKLKGLLRVESLIVIPTEPGDVVGHADGVVRFIDSVSVIINDYRRIDRSYRARLLKPLKAAGLSVVELIYQPGLDDQEEIPSAVGNYVNFL
jgi:agmatine deiminase